MTTIVWDGRYLACDSQTTNGDMIASLSTNKILEFNDDCKYQIIAFSGDDPDSDKLIECAVNEIKITKKLNANLISIDKYMTAHIHGRDEEEYWRSKCCESDAVGSGAKYALTAIDCGKSAMDAVIVAMNRDIFSGGAIRFFDTQNPKLGVQIYT